MQIQEQLTAIREQLTRIEQSLAPKPKRTRQPNKNPFTNDAWFPEHLPQLRQSFPIFTYDDIESILPTGASTWWLFSQAEKHGIHSKRKSLRNKDGTITKPRLYFFDKNHLKLPFAQLYRKWLPDDQPLPDPNPRPFDPKQQYRASLSEDQFKELTQSHHGWMEADGYISRNEAIMRDIQNTDTPLDEIETTPLPPDTPRPHHILIRFDTEANYNKALSIGEGNPALGVIKLYQHTIENMIIG